MIKKSNIQIQCNNCHNYNFRDAVKIPLGKYFYIGCNNCKYSRYICLPEYTKVGDYVEYFIDSSCRMAVGIYITA